MPKQRLYLQNFKVKSIVLVVCELQQSSCPAPVFSEIRGLIHIQSEEISIRSCYFSKGLSQTTAAIPAGQSEAGWGIRTHIHRVQTNTCHLCLLYGIVTKTEFTLKTMDSDDISSQFWSPMCVWFLRQIS